MTPTALARSRPRPLTPLLSVFAVLAMVMALVPFAMSPAAAQTDPDLPPEEGGQDDALNLTASDAVGYAIAWSQVTYTPLGDEGPETPPTEALLGRDDLFADNLASGALQGQAAEGENGAPLLLTDSTDLSDETLAELDRLSGRDNDDEADDADFTVRILGGVDAISETVEQELADAGYTVERNGGETRIETAIEVAATQDSDTVLVVRAFPSDSGDETQAFADSLGAGALAATNGWEILFTQSDVLTGNTATALEEGGYTQAYVVGGTDAISDDVLTQVTERVDSTERVAGETRFETAVELNGLREGDLGDIALLVDGQASDAWADGFPAANLSGLNNYPLVLSNQGMIPAETEAYLADFGADDSTTFTAHFEGVVLVCGGTADADTCQAALDIINGEEGGEVRPFPGDAPEEPVFDTYTDAPELTGVTLEEPAEDATGDEVQLRFTFDEDITGKTPVAECFHLYTYDLTELPAPDGAEECTTAGGGHEGDDNANPQSVDGTDAEIPADDATSVLVTFPMTEEELATASLATVDWDAVTDTDDVENLEGALALDPVLTGGTTAAPDLVEIRAGDSDTEIAFVFDEPVAEIVEPTGFVLVDAEGTAQQSESAEASTTEGEDNVVIATFADAPAADPVRAGVLANSVGEAVEEGAEAATNPLQTVDVASDGVTADPDLISIAVDRENSTVTYTFDEAVDVQGGECAAVTDPVTGTPLEDPTGFSAEPAACFQVYDRSGSETDAAEVDNTGSTVVATFPEGTLDDALGASVEADAVSAVQGDNNTNEIGELAIEDLVIEAGHTPAPDLVSAAVVASDAFETETVVEYTFDEEIVASEPNPITGGTLSPDPMRFFIYDAEGTPTRGTAAEVDEDDATVVRVIFGEAEATEDAPSSDEAIAAAVTATVNDLAVFDDDGNGNPEGIGGSLVQS